MDLTSEQTNMFIGFIVMGFVSFCIISFIWMLIQTEIKENERRRKGREEYARETARAEQYAEVDKRKSEQRLVNRTKAIKENVGVPRYPICPNCGTQSYQVYESMLRTGKFVEIFRCRNQHLSCGRCGLSGCPKCNERTKTKVGILYSGDFE